MYSSMELGVMRLEANVMLTRKSSHHGFIQSLPINSWPMNRHDNKVDVS